MRDQKGWSKLNQPSIVSEYGYSRGHRYSRTRTRIVVRVGVTNIISHNTESVHNSYCGATCMSRGIHRRRTEVRRTVGPQGNGAAVCRNCSRSLRDEACAALLGDEYAGD